MVKLWSSSGILEVLYLTIEPFKPSLVLWDWPFSTGTFASDRKLFTLFFGKHSSVSLPTLFIPVQYYTSKTSRPLGVNAVDGTYRKIWHVYSSMFFFMYRYMTNFSVTFRFEMKHSKQLEESRAVSLAAVKELEQLQVGWPQRVITPWGAKPCRLL